MSINATDLSKAQKRALEIARSARVVRVTNGWRGRGTGLIPVATAKSLVALGLAATRLVRHQQQLVQTPEGESADDARGAAPRELRAVTQALRRSYHDMEERLESIERLLAGDAQ
jgi:hypothetical protein